MRENSQTVIIYCHHFNVGGTETLILRLMNYYVNLGIRAIMLTLYPVVNKKILSDLKSKKFERYFYNDRQGLFLSGQKRLSFENQEEPIVITQFLPEFFKANKLLDKSKYGVRFDFKLYIVHPYSSYYGPKLLKGLAKILIKKMVRTQSLFFMDSVCVEHCIKFYGLESAEGMTIFHLPVVVDSSYPITVQRNNIVNILTLSRFEFPFKGYVLGLINSFKVLAEKIDNVKLTIIGNGSGLDNVERTISGLPSHISKRVSLLDEVPYSKINSYIKECDVFVGMGTSILDAANQNKIVIAAVAYQLDSWSTGFFHENFSSVGELYSKNTVYDTFDLLIKKVIDATPKEFEKWSLKSKKMLAEHYNIDVIAHKLIKTSLVSNLKEKIVLFLCREIHLLTYKFIELNRRAFFWKS